MEIDKKKTYTYMIQKNLFAIYLISDKVLDRNPPVLIK
jgi:hypothetical protein